MRNTEDIGRAVASELDQRAGEFDQEPNFDALVARLNSPGELVIVPPHERGSRHQLILAAAAVALIVAGTLAVVGQRETATEVDAVTSLPIEVDELYYWPSELPPSWQILETDRRIDEDQNRSDGVLAAISSDDQSIMITAALDDGGQDDGEQDDERPVSVKVIDGVEYGVIYADQFDTVLAWNKDGYRFQMVARQVGFDEAFRLASKTVAEHNPSTDEITELTTPFTDGYDVVVDRQPDNSDNELFQVFRLGCPEVDPGEGCVLQLTVGSPLLGSGELALADRRVALTTTEHSIECGDVTIGTEQLGGIELVTAVSFLDNGLEVVIRSDTGPLGEPLGFGAVGVGHSPFDLADVETLVCHLDQVDPETYRELAALTE